MQPLRRYINRIRAPDSLDQRKQLLTNIKDFALLLAQEGLLYPQLADMFFEEFKWYGREKQRDATGAESDRYKATCLEEALQAARKMLELDVLCNGHESTAVQKSLDAMGVLIID